MKKNVYLFLGCLLLLTGCPLLPTLPSIEHCYHVQYERTGNKATLEAECTV